MPDVFAADDHYYKNPRPEMVKFLPARRARVLDVGCGQASFSTSIPGVEEVWGIEPTVAGEAATDRIYKMVHGTFDDARPQLPLAYFDLVICNDVIEHMTDHDKFLAEVKDHIAPGGVLVGSIPNVRYFVNMFDVLVGKDWEYQDSGIMDRTHFRFFTERSLKRAFARHGYKIEAFEGINSGLAFARSVRYRLPKRYQIFNYLARFGSFGYFSDIQHLQFAFRVCPVAPQ